MENSIYLGLSRQKALETNMQIIANNIANMSTSGYRAQNLMFSEHLSDPRGGDDALSFVDGKRQYEVTQEGPVSRTENPMDVYLSGPGFMGVTGPGGNIFYTRAGNLQIDAQGQLITAAGFPVAGNGGGAITIPTDSTEISIDEAGRISNQNGEVGQIQIVEFANPQAAEPVGNGLYRNDGATGAPTETTVIQGMLEGSNVKPIVEMTRMIETLRSFTGVQDVIETENERLMGAIQKLTSRG